tara:strand:+ start:1653 stop:2018 length:366 start_codon:yes stop_codon:yes gene_type:complete
MVFFLPYGVFGNFVEKFYKPTISLGLSVENRPLVFGDEEPEVTAPSNDDDDGDGAVADTVTQPELSREERISNVAERWGISKEDAAELIDTFENSQGSESSQVIPQMTVTEELRTFGRIIS